MITERRRLMLAIRAPVTDDVLRHAIAASLHLSLGDVRALGDDADPAVRYERHEWPLGFRLVVDLYIDPLRVAEPSVARLAPPLAGALGQDVAHHDGSKNPYAYTLVRADGRRLAVEEIETEGAWLVLDE